jgi:ketosteroid isomerase-like protein
MLGSSIEPLNTARLHRFHPRWAIAAALALAVGAVPLFAGGLSLAQKHESRHEVDQLEDEWRTATLGGDAKAMDSLLADDYMAITAAGTLQSRDETLANLRSGRLHFTTLTITDRKVRFYGTTAVVTSLATIEATNPDGPVTGDYRYTHVYVRNAQGVWKIVSFEASHVREAGQHRRNEFH